MTDPVSQIADAAANAPLAPDLRPAGRPGDRQHLDSWVLPPDCPVRPLGHLKKVLYVLDVDGQLLELAPKLPKEDIVYIFGDAIGWLEEQDSLAAWKCIGKDKKTDTPVYEKNGFDQRKVQEAMVRACRRKGFLDIAGKVRGRGSHRGPDEELILHCGDQILVGGRKGMRGKAGKSQFQDTGEVGELIFPTAPALPHPTQTPAASSVGVALLDILTLWNWQGTARLAMGKKTVPIEALLLMGWIGCAKLCGAIDWRPHIWLIGPSGAGKSTLQKLISRLLAKWALESQDPSEAWITQSLKDQRLAVLYDEPEPGDGEDGAGFVRKIIKLARLASQGGNKGRGAQDHNAVQFDIYSAFLFSSIMHHELEQQDRNRMAILALSKFPPDTAAMTVDTIEVALEKRWKVKGTLQDMGLGITRRLVEQWGRYRATLGVYQAELLRKGADPRAQNTYGEILAMADMMLFDTVPVSRDVGDPNPPEEGDDRVGAWVEAVLPLLSAAAAESENVGERCLARLTQYRLKAAGGMHEETVGRWIEKALAVVLLGEPDRLAARDKLRTHGLKLVHRKGEEGTQEAYTDPDNVPIYLAVANKNHEALKQIFAGTIWKGGEWGQALGPAHVNGAVAKLARVRFHGPPQWARLVPIGEVIDIAGARAEAQRIKEKDLAS